MDRETPDGSGPTRQEHSGPGLRPPQRRYVDEVVRTLIDPLIENPELPAGWRLVSWETEQGFSLTLARGESSLILDFEERDENGPCHARTRYFNVSIQWIFGPRVAFGKADVEAFDRIVDVVREREPRIEIPERPTTSRRTVVRQILVERMLIPEGNGQYYINPYVGCMIGCEFCYVIDRADWSRRLEGLPHLPWGRWVDVKVNGPEILRREVKETTPGPVRFSPILTDPYQSVDRRFRITRQCLEVLLETDFIPLILTRARRVLDDIDLLARFPRVAVGFSIPSDDDRYRARFEPGADPIEDRIEALKQLQAAGVRTYAVIQPVLPMNPEKLARMVAPLVRAVRIERMTDLFRSRHIYEKHGLLDFATDAYFDQTIAELTDWFTKLGIPMDEMDNMGPLLAD